MKVSVVIPVFNEEDAVQECLVSLSMQTTKDFEVIVIDDGSKDSSLNILKNYKSKNFIYRILKQKHLGPAMARNKGARIAKGKVLVFVDADMTFDKNFLKELVQLIEVRKSKGTFSNQEYVSNWDNVWARCWNYNKNISSKKRVTGEKVKQKVFRAILKSEFDKVGGFSKGGYTDDYTLAEKLGYEADLVKGAKFFHKNPDTLKKVFMQAKWSAKRKYKLGIIGAIGRLALNYLLILILVGIYKAIKYKTPKFVVFKIVYGLGTAIGILEYFVLRRGY